MSTDRRSIKRALKRLEHAYGRREWVCWGKGVDVLVGTILSQNTSRANSQAGYKQLRREFRSWNQAADAPVEQVERCIRISGLSKIKAPRIQKILRELRDRHGRISLEYLRHMNPEDAYAELTRFHGVGAKTASCVLLFAYNLPIFPVDTHIRRIAERLGWVSKGTSADDVQRELTPLIAPEDNYSLHILLVEHGRQTCKARNPKCDWCDLLSLCPFGQVRLAEE